MKLIVALIASWVAVGVFQNIARSQGWGQRVRQDGPQGHLVKEGTPTMGGVPFSLVVFVVWFALVGFSGESDTKGWAAVLMALAMGLIGFMDDYLIVRSRLLSLAQRGGMPARVKWPLQLLVAVVFSLAVAREFSHTGTLWLDVVLYTFVTVGAVNAVNFTDGLDGLAAGVVLIMLLPLIVTSPLAGITVGALVGYLWFNVKPASIFMGDAGSHALGGIVAGVYITQGWMWVLPLAAIIPVLEVLSVMIQVPYFQYTRRVFGEGRRVFLMTPIHHHFEKLGWPETKVVGRFWAVTALGTALAWVIQTGTRT
jgi:phospho-N-acetylmuramoyl-pentapeptide-transferase